MRLLVTGGAGYIGSVMTAQLLVAGHEVTVFDNLSRGHIQAVSEGARFIEGDLPHEERANSVLTMGFDDVLHFAAMSLVGESVQQPACYYRNNVCGTLNLLDAMRAARVPCLVFSTTAAVYEVPYETPIRETAVPRPTNPLWRIEDDNRPDGRLHGHSAWPSCGQTALLQCCRS